YLTCPCLGNLIVGSTNAMPSSACSPWDRSPSAPSSRSPTATVDTAHRPTAATNVGTGSGPQDAKRTATRPLQGGYAEPVLAPRGAPAREQSLESNLRDSARSASRTIGMSRYITTENGRPINTAAAWSVYTPSIKTMTSVNARVITAQTMRSHGAPSESCSEALEVIFAMTREPESAEVM